jgi:Rad3-related DNA helicase
MLADTGRVLSHTSDDFTEKLQAFYDSDKPLVFISPSVREGVDFKDDLARFQCIIRPPYAPATDPYFKWLISNGRWDLYYRQAAVEFGQMLGRPVRHKGDHGVTYLISSTFGPFLEKISNQLPTWQKAAFVN